MERKFELSTDRLLADLKLVEYENEFLRTTIDELEVELAEARVQVNNGQARGKGQKPAKKPPTL